MKISELHLAAVVAIATVFGGISSALIRVIWTDASTEHKTDAQFVQLSIGILSTPIAQGSINTLGSVQTGQTVLRTWAVDMINEYAEVKFDEEAKRLLINGAVNLPKPAVSEELRRAVEASRQALEALQPPSDDLLP